MRAALVTPCPLCRRGESNVLRSSAFRDCGDRDRSFDCRALCRHDPGRAWCRGHQGREPKGRRCGPRLGTALPGRRLDLLSFGQSGKARHHDRSRRSRRCGAVAQADPGTRRCRDPQSKYGALDKYGLGPSALLTEKPALVCCNLAAFGNTGPLRDRPGYDPMMQAYSGLMSLLGEDGRPPVRVTASIIDMGAAMWAVIGTLAALRERDRSGQGGIVDTSL